jgi:hypothetical protein
MEKIKDLNEGLKKCLNNISLNLENLSDQINTLDKRINPLIEYDVEAKKAIHELKSVRTKLLCDHVILIPLLMAKDMQALTMNKFFDNIGKGN